MTASRLLTTIRPAPSVTRAKRFFKFPFWPRFAAGIAREARFIERDASALLHSYRIFARVTEIVEQPKTDRRDDVLTWQMPAIAASFSIQGGQAGKDFIQRRWVAPHPNARCVVDRVGHGRARA